MGEIYKISNDINDFVYIGKTVKNTEQRKKAHLNQLNDGTDIHNAILKFGLEHFTWSVVEKDIYDNTLLAEREKYWINYYNSYKNGYNMTPGGEGGNGTHAKNLEKWRKENPDKTKELIQNLLEWQKNNPDKVKENNQRAGQTRKQKYGKDITKKANEAARKKVICIETNIEYESASAAAKSLGYKSGAHIGQVCNGKRKTAFGYHWMWAN